MIVSFAASAKTPERKIDFNTQIKPIFKRSCYDCHTSDYLKGGLDLATRTGLLKGGNSGKLFVAGKSTQSLIIKRLRGQGGTRMPKGELPLDDSQIKLIARWIDQGARM